MKANRVRLAPAHHLWTSILICENLSSKNALRGELSVVKLTPNVHLVSCNLDYTFVSSPPKDLALIRIYEWKLRTSH